MPAQVDLAEQPDNAALPDPEVTNTVPRHVTAGRERSLLQQADRSAPSVPVALLRRELFSSWHRITLRFAETMPYNCPLVERREQRII
jgi:hypothetical protein